MWNPHRTAKGGTGVATSRPEDRLVASCRHRRFRPGVALVTATLILLAGCEGGSSPTPSTISNPFPRVSAAEFHRIGVVARASRLAPGETPAERLGVTEQQVRDYAAQLCDGVHPILHVTYTQFPNQVPAFEAVFDDVRVNCLADVATLDLARGSIARSIAGNAELLARIDGQARADQFCEAVGDSEDVTTSLIVEAMLETRMVSSRYADVAELGVTLLLASCPLLLGRLGP